VLGAAELAAVIPAEHAASDMPVAQAVQATRTRQPERYLVIGFSFSSFR
jgi:hypothetical protein